MYSTGIGREKNSKRVGMQKASIIPIERKRIHNRGVPKTMHYSKREEQFLMQREIHNQIIDYSPRAGNISIRENRKNGQYSYKGRRKFYKRGSHTQQQRQYTQK